MGELEKIFEGLRDYEHCKLTPGGVYVASSGAEMRSAETLEVAHPSRNEKVSIGYFGFDPDTRVSFIGDDSDLGRETIERLRLPEHQPSNLGEQMFWLLRDDMSVIPAGDFHVERACKSELEHEFLFVLRKLVHVYRGGEIDGKFFETYAALKVKSD